MQGFLIEELRVIGRRLASSRYPNSGSKSARTVFGFPMFAL